MTGTNEDGEEIYEPGSLRDLVPWCQVVVSAEFTQIYCSGAGWGPNFDALDVLIYEPNPDDMGEETEEDEGFAFAGVGNFAKRKTSTEEGDNGAEAGVSNEGDGNNAGDQTTTDDEHIGKRMRISASGDQDPYSDDDRS